jgi:hypothetical protein
VGGWCSRRSIFRPETLQLFYLANHQNSRVTEIGMIGAPQAENLGIKR